MENEKSPWREKLRRAWPQMIGGFLVLTAKGIYDAFLGEGVEKLTGGGQGESASSPGEHWFADYTWPYWLAVLLAGWGCWAMSRDRARAQRELRQLKALHSIGRSIYLGRPDVDDVLERQDTLMVRLPVFNGSGDPVTLFGKEELVYGNHLVTGQAVVFDGLFKPIAPKTVHWIGIGIDLTGEVGAEIRADMESGELKDITTSRINLTARAGQQSDRLAFEGAFQISKSERWSVGHLLLKAVNEGVGISEGA